MFGTMMNSSEALKKLQSVELEILRVVDAFCREHDIQYFIDGGTALGAARHRGFIPWDDDIDIGMLREDYELFCSLALTGLPEGYSLHTARNSEGYPALFAKVYKDGTLFVNEEALQSGSNMGIFIDVFPYDRLYQETSLRNKQIRNASLSQKRSYLYYLSTITVPHKGFLGSLERISCRLMHRIERLMVSDPSVYQDFFDRSVPSSDIGDISDSCLTLVWPNMSPISISDVFPLASLSFEGECFPVPRNIDFYLTNMYGDWRVLPPREDRHTHLPLSLDFGDGSVWNIGSQDEC